MKKHIIALALISLSTITTAADKIRIVTSTSEHFSTAALLPHFCKKHDLDVSVKQLSSAVYDNATGGIALIERKEADIVSMPLPSGIIAYSNGVKIYPIANMAVNGIDFIVTDTINGYADLKGKTIAQLRGSGTQTQINKALKANGLKLDDVKFVFMSYSQMPAAFENKSVDGFVGSYPFTLIGLNAGGKSIDNFPDVVRPLWGADSISTASLVKFKKCHNEMINFVGAPKNKTAVASLIADVEKQGLKVYLPSNIKYSYTLSSVIPDSTVEDAVMFLKENKRIKSDFVVDSTFNKAK